MTGNLEDGEEWPDYSTAAAWHRASASSESESLIFQKELSGILQEEIKRLPVIYQTLVTLFHQESLSYQELTQITGLPEGTVKSHLFRARKMLKENLLLKYKKEAL